MSLNLDGKPKGDNRMLAVALAVIAAGLLVFAAFSKDWVARPAPVNIGFGPMGCHNCAIYSEEGTGGSMTNGAFIAMMRERTVDMWGSDEHAHLSNAFAPMGWATFALCLISALGLLGGAFLAYTKQRRDLPVAPTTIALLGLMASLITACVFVATKPGGPGFVGISLGFWAYGIASVMGIASAQMIAKLIRPVDQDLVDAALMIPD